ncbi:hypothetical protein [Pseudogemmobacter humi]|uniref:Phosphotransferase enzyme family protein n=1 Tax=Pseudogemmobacter humi TaxID=2483812 RepID=A0A3P5WHP1_9RHOB|nr:hypothetical protein [Pseudogemmobacter humi]VDC20282.1 hypothetical protein XINFAN_00411 [Pseudogemmobacter humi]
MSRTAEIRALAARDPVQAEARLAALLGELFGITARDLRINHDQYSLNSLNGFFTCERGACFFKFHQEEGEEQMRGEYYRADILARAGLPVDQPILTSTLPGEQILVYRRRQDPRFSDVLRALDLAPDAQAEARALAAERDLNARLLEVAKASLHPITPAEARAEPIHRLFHERLIDPATGRYPAGRLASFYIGKDFDLPGMTAPWEQISRARPVINGVAYRHSLAELFDAAHDRLAPENLADAGGIVAHGDAHNANVWYERGAARDRLAFFDPAFAGENVPSLLAEVKSTFHNILAHPLWLYDSEMVPGRWQVSARLTGDALHIDTDWAPGPLREALLAVKAETFWKPWLAHLAERGLLPADWERVVRLALFLCPTLVMNLRAGEGGGRHNPASSVIGLAQAVVCGSAPLTGEDRMSRFFDAIRP